MRQRINGIARCEPILIQGRIFAIGAGPLLLNLLAASVGLVVHPKALRRTAGVGIVPTLFYRLFGLVRDRAPKPTPGMHRQQPAAERNSGRQA
jgi:hypothetical protein